MTEGTWHEIYTRLQCEHFAWQTRFFFHLKSLTLESHLVYSLMSNSDIYGIKRFTIATGWNPHPAVWTAERLVLRILCEYWYSLLDTKRILQLEEIGEKSLLFNRSSSRKEEILFRNREIQWVMLKISKIQHYIRILSVPVELTWGLIKIIL